MSSGLTTTAANAAIDWTHGNTPANSPSGTHKLALTTTAPTASAAGTKVTGGSYADQTVAMSAAASASAGNSGTLTYSSMPAVNGANFIVGVDEYDATPFRWWFGQLTAQKQTNAGDTVTVGTGAYTTGITSP